MKNLDILLHGHARAKPDYEPRPLVEAVTGNVVLNGAPLERFSKERPVYVPPEPNDEEYRPIDVLYGSYDPVTCTIEIYVDNIRHDAALFGEYEDVLEIVRIHEYAHAIVHLGVHVDRVIETLDAMGEKRKTDWEAFLDARTGAFQETDTASHEFLAQAITVAALRKISDGPRAARLRDTFDALERRQPSHYVLPEEIKGSANAVAWPLVLAAARRDIDVFRGEDFSLREGLCTLARDSLGSTGEPPAMNREWVVGLDDERAADELRTSLLEDDGGRHSSGGDAVNRLLLDRVGSLRIEVFAREHPPPHFRVICGEESASYRIADCHQLNGGLRRQYRVVRKWHANNKAKLVDAWNHHRPADCPVGAYREP